MKGIHIDKASKDVASCAVNDAEGIVTAKQARERKWELRCQSKGREHEPCDGNPQQKSERLPSRI